MKAPSKGGGRLSRDEFPVAIIGVDESDRILINSRHALHNNADAMYLAVLLGPASIRAMWLTKGHEGHAVAPSW